jgi:hypothetical protein
MIRHLKFCGDLIQACYWLAVEAYYALAAKTIHQSHPDSWLITRRLLDARSRVNDFISKVTT